MISKKFFNLDVESDNLRKDLDAMLSNDEYNFLLYWSPGEEIVLLSCAVEINSKFHTVIDKPISDFSGSLAISLGFHKEHNFKVHFRIYNPSTIQKIPKTKTFVVNTTQKKSLKTLPAGKKFKALKIKELWQSRL